MVTVDGRPVAQLGPLEPDRAAPTLARPRRRRPGRAAPRRADAGPPEAANPPVGVRLDRLLAEVRGR